MTIGNDILPGIVTDIESLPAVSIGGLSGANVILVGQGNLSEGEAEPNQPYTVTRSSQVRQWFGEDTMISGAIEDALNEGALPVYAVVTDESINTETTDSSSGTLAETPTSEDPTSYDVESEYEVEIVMDDPVQEDGKLQINPVTGDYEYGSTPPTGAEITYTSYDYSGALDSVEDAPNSIDYLYVLNENDGVKDELESAIEQLRAYKNLVIGGIGATTYSDDVSTIEAPYDTSRIQVFYPSRNDDGDTIMGAIGGRKASMGISGSTMNKRLSTHDRLYHRITQGDQMDLLEESIVPVASESRGSLLVDDPTCVSDDNAEESNMADGYSRLIVNRVTDIVHDTERPYIGKLNKASTRGSLQASIRTGISFLKEQDAVVDYHVRVHKGDSMSAYVDVGIETTKPLRNVYNTISVGDTE